MGGSIAGRRLRRRLGACALGLALVVAAVPAAAGAGGPVGATAPAAEAAGVVSGTPLTLLGRLRTARERRSGYDRDLFPHWIDADGDGCDTRAEVMIAESVTRVSVSPSCWVTGGRWYSAYDGVTTTVWGDIDIDHVVALAEAWDSGAHAWPESRRRAFANDLGDRRALRGVTDNVNMSKSDRDPAEWLPPRASFHCTYVTEWVVVKVRWKLTVDSAERAAIRSVLQGCPAPTVRVAVV